MKRYLLHTTKILAFALVINADTVTAEERHIYVEMPESGVYIEFQISEKELQKAEKQDNTAIEHLAAIRRTRVNKQSRWVEKIELPESGNYLEFSMTIEEIRSAKKSEDAGKGRFMAKRASTMKKQKRWVEKTELPESGNYIFFEISREMPQLANHGSL